MNNISFSAYYTDKLGEEIKKRVLDQCPDGYEMTFLNSSKDLISIVNAWNHGIDSYLEALTARSLYFPCNPRDYSNMSRSMFIIHPEELHVLIRRLLEDDDENANSLASDICSTLGIELV